MVPEDRERRGLAEEKDLGHAMDRTVVHNLHKVPQHSSARFRFRVGCVEGTRPVIVDSSGLLSLRR